VSLVNAIVSVLIVIIVCQTMLQTHFRSLKITQNKSDVTNRFGDRDFVLAVCTCFLSNSDRFEVIRDFRSLNHGGIPFPVDGCIAEKCDVTIQFLIGSLVIHFAGIFHVFSPFKSYSISCLWKFFFNFWGQI
jgi:hypothetical protein